MTYRRASLSVFLWLCIALLASLLLAASVAAAYTPPEVLQGSPGGIEGVLYEPDNVTPVEGGWIDIVDSNGAPWAGTSTGISGYYVFPTLSPDHYTLRAHPPGLSPYAGSRPMEVIVTSGQITQANLRLTDVSLSGVVVDCDNTEIHLEGSRVVVHDLTGPQPVALWDVTNANGEFKIGGLADGITYPIEAEPPSGSAYLPMEPISVTPVFTNVVLLLCTPPTNVIGTIIDPLGAPVPDAEVTIYRNDYWEETLAGAGGEFAFYGLPTGDFMLQANPPWDGQGLLPHDPIPVFISMPTTLIDMGTITLPHSSKTVTGYVRFEGTSTGVPDAEVWAYRLDGTSFAHTPTSGDGSFVLGLSGGKWHLSVKPLVWPSSWVFAGAMTQVEFADDDTIPESATVNLEVVATDAWIQGVVDCYSGCPPDLGYEDVWVEVRNDGFGNGSPLNPDFTFNIPIPHGWYELAIHVNHPGFQGPKPQQVFVGPGQALDLGVIKLVTKDATIMGWVHDESGVGVEGISIVGWQKGEESWSWAETDASGNYTMPVVGGSWFVEPVPGPERPYVYRGEPESVKVTSGGTQAGVNFGLTEVDAHVKGIAVDSVTHQRIWGLDGWAWAEQYVGPPDEYEFFADAPMRHGSFELRVQGGYTYRAGLDLPPHAAYVSGSAGEGYVDVDATVTISVPLEAKDAVIQGSLVQVQARTLQQDPISAVVFGKDEQGHWASADVDPDTSEYQMDVVSGTWHLRAWVDPETGYVADPDPVKVTVQAGQTVVQDFDVQPIAAIISGTVLDPDGWPIHAFVFAHGKSPLVGRYETFVETDENGNFVLTVPDGTYDVGAALPDDDLEAWGWLNPPPIEDVVAATGTPVTDLVLRFRHLDSAIQGTISFASGIVVTPSHSAYVWGWAKTGEWAETKATQVDGTSTFTYVLPAISGTQWYVGAVYEDWDQGVVYKSPKTNVMVSSAQVIHDLELQGPWSLPHPIVASFDGDEMQTIELPGDIELSIPPGALTVSGTATLYIFPTHEIRPDAGHTFIGAGFEIWATDEDGQEITHFNQDVVLILHYSEEELTAQGISENALIPVYYSTLVGQWILADSYVVDTDNNQITIQLDHFSRFGVCSFESGYELYLPLVLKDF